MLLDLLQQLRADIEEVIARHQDGGEASVPDVRKLLQPLLSHANLTVRDEFDIQVQHLERARAKVSELEARLGELERRVTDPQ